MAQKPKSTGEEKPEHPLHSVYVNMKFLETHVEMARKNIKQLEELKDIRICKYSIQEFDYIDDCLKDMSRKIMKYIERISTERESKRFIKKAMELMNQGKKVVI